MNVILFDCESSSLKNPRLVQLAWKVGSHDVQQTFYKPPVQIEYGAMAVHHITEEDVAEAPIFGENDVKMWTEKFTENIPVAHNLPFDVGVMANEGVHVNGGICTLKVARALFPHEEAHKLQHLRYSLKLEVDRKAVAHDARGDVMVLDALFKKLFNCIQAGLTKESKDDVLNRMIEITGQPSIIYKINFGKHRGMSIEDLIQKEPGYVKWLLNQSTLDADLKYSIKYFTKKVNQQ